VAQLLVTLIEQKEALDLRTIVMMLHEGANSREVSFCTLAAHLIENAGCRG